MNLIEYLIKEDALGNKSKRSAIAGKILRAEIEATVAIYAQMLPVADISSLIRKAMTQPAKPVHNSPLDLPKYKAELVKLAAGQDVDFEVLRHIDICKTHAVGTGECDKKAHIAYLKTVIDELDEGATWKVIQKHCCTEAEEKDTPFLVIDGALALKTNEEVFSDKTFQNWITSAKNMR